VVALASFHAPQTVIVQISNVIGRKVVVVMIAVRSIVQSVLMEAVVEQEASAVPLRQKRLSAQVFHAIHTMAVHIPSLHLTVVLLTAKNVSMEAVVEQEASAVPLRQNQSIVLTSHAIHTMAAERVVGEVEAAVL
jgi:hypothetical protein